jgi:hypothetical protein
MEVWFESDVPGLKPDESAGYMWFLNTKTPLSALEALRPRQPVIFTG